MIKAFPAAAKNFYSNKLNDINIVVFASSTEPLCTQAVAVATILAPTQTLPRLRPRRAKRVKRATPCQAEVVAIFVWGRELLPQRPPGYAGVGSTSEHDNILGDVVLII